jgi:hypothetical protein
MSITPWLIVQPGGQRQGDPDERGVCGLHESRQSAGFCADAGLVSHDATEGIWGATQRHVAAQLH